MISELLRVLAYAVVASAPPFGVVVAFYFLIGLGQAINLALSQVFCANLVNSTRTLGIFHGCYGIGGTLGPLIATAMVSRGILWSRFYFVQLGLVSISCLVGGWAFRGYEQEQPAQLFSRLQQTASRQQSEPGEPTRRQLLWQAAKNKITILGALFIFAYQGAEVSVSGWVITFLIHYRKGNPDQVGYVTAGFWAGITLGRFVLSQPAHKIGEKISVFGLVIGSVAFQLLVWLVPNVVGDAVAVAILGLMLGPIYPCVINVFTRLLSRHLQTSSLSIISALGSSGGAIVPFAVGLSAQKVGTFVLHPIAIACYVAMEVCWLSLPRMGKRAAE